MEKYNLDSWLEFVLNEDVGDGDHTTFSTVPHDAIGKARLLIKEDGVLAGVDIAKRVFKMVDPELKMDIRIVDGSEVKYGDEAFYVEGRAQSILIAERLVLNIMQRMSGIATKTRQMVRLVANSGTRILDTRKTTPGMRYLEKLSVVLGGGVNHRFGLYDMILIKDNHIDYCGDAGKALNQAKEYLKDNELDLKIEVEARDLSEVKDILNEGGAHRILLDNFEYEDLKKAVEMIGNKAETEASGGITEESVAQYAACGVDYISSGALTHSVKSLDMSLKAMK